MKNKFWLPLILAVTMVFGIFIGWILNHNRHASVSGQGKLLEVLSLINENYVDEIEIDSLVEMTLPLILENLDPHSSYIPARDLVKANSELDGKFSGIGISFQILDDTLNVIEVINGGPAEKVGVMAGDRIIKVDGKDIAGTGIKEDDVFSMLRGEKGTKVNISVKRSNSKKPVDFEIIRDDIPIESVDAFFMLNDNTGYVKVSRFARNTFFEFLTALNELRLEGAENFVIDLRYNGGGYMEPAVNMVNEFLDEGDIIVSTKGRIIGEDQTIIADGSGSFKNFGLVVLTNEFSASASEIFSGAIQDNDRGWIVGRRTFGKGLVQRPVLLPDSSEVRLTVQRYYTPSGRCIQKDYTPGKNSSYDQELIDRFNSGELLSADSVKLNIDQKFLTMGGRTVYGGGGIMPDYFVPEDTANVTSYYSAVVNAGLISKYAYEFSDMHRNELSDAEDVDQMLEMLPSDNVLLRDFVSYAASRGVPARWYYINISSPLIVNQLKAVIARSIFGFNGYYEVLSKTDKTIDAALKHIDKPLTAK